MADVPICPAVNCSRPDKHPGRHGKPNQREMRRFGYEHATQAEIRLWHHLNARK